MNSKLLFAALWLASVLTFGDFPGMAAAQIQEDKPAANGPQYGPPDSIRFRVGAEITASRGPCKDIMATVAVPLECPEQTVEIVAEDFSPEVGSVTYRVLQGGKTLGGVRQMMISVPC